MNIQFIGAAREVTGSKHIITTESGKKILLDCGLYQGKGQESFERNRHLGFDPMSIDYVILSHAHIDHSGLIPLLTKEGYSGLIFTTPATRDLCSIMLIDSAIIQEQDIVYVNKKREKLGHKPIKPLYSIKDAAKSLRHFVTIPYNLPFRIDNEITLTFTNAGHILGSAVVNLEIKESNNIKKTAFTGDIGRQKPRIIKQPDKFPQADIIICEATYGNRLHRSETIVEKELLDILVETCIIKKGKLIIPAFSLGRTQEIIYALDKLETSGRLPTQIKVFIDSPLSVNATNIMRMHHECFNDDVVEYMRLDPNPFGFNNLKYIQSIEESKMLNTLKEPCIIISASGMMEAGRIKHHLANNIENENNTILITGYCEPQSLGGLLLQGEKEVRIFGDFYQVKADIKSLEDLSAHADYEEILSFLECQDPKQVKQFFIVHGDYEAQKSLKEKLEAKGYSNIEIPAPKQSYFI